MNRFTKIEPICSNFALENKKKLRNAQGNAGQCGQNRWPQPLKNNPVILCRITNYS